MDQINKKIALFICLVTFCLSSLGQRHQWAKSIPKSGAIGTSIAVDKRNNVYMAGLFHDTLFIDSNIIPPPISQPFQGNFLNKFDSKGKFIWSKPMFLLAQSSSVNWFYISGMKVISSNRIAVYGWFSGGNGILKLSKNDSIIGVTGQVTTGFIALFDSSGTVIKGVKAFEGVGFELWNSNGLTSRLEVDQQQNLYIQFYKSEFSNGFIVNKGGNIALNDTIARSIIVKYPPGLDSVVWYKNFPDARNILVERISIGEDNNLYLSCNTKGGSFNLNSTTYTFGKYQKKGFITVLNSSGGFVYTGVINSDTNKSDLLVEVMAKDLNNVYILGFVEDSLYYQGKWFASLNPGSMGNFFPYLGRVSLSKGAKWVKLSRDKTSAAFYSMTNPLGKLAFDKQGNVYASFYYWHQGISYGGLTDSSYIRHAFIKFDSLGNALWIHNLHGRPDGIQADYDTNIIFTGFYSKQITFYPFTLKSNFTSLYLTKVMDYSIRRGRVKFGPYCAGDSIIIPYSKRGIYDSANYFVAELSDEKGDFEGQERELGRIKSMNGGFVKAVLPNFKVASSGKYRIRIRSTSPQIQSFYQKDTLRLLIYSRDKADPGPSETICYGDSLQIQTYGGTKWTWTPQYNMDDSTQREVKIWPLKTTKYQIIIADSSGCGAPDTAYKLITVHPPLKSVLGFNDTALCISATLNIPVQFTGGDSTNYQWQWFFVNTPKQWFAMGKGKNKLRDTLIYTPTDPIEKLAIVLKDNCTDRSDTTYLTMSIRTPIVILPKFRDTVLCKGNIIHYITKASGGLPAKYRWIWKDVITNQLLSSSDSLKIIANQTIKIELSVSDGCQSLADENKFTVFVNPALKASILTTKGSLSDTTLCFYRSLKLFSTGKGGTGSGYKFNWYLDKTLISNADTLSFKSDVLYPNTTSTKTLKLVLKDNCTSGSDSISRNIKVIPGPQSEFKWGIACNKTKVPFTFTGNLAASPVTTKYSWHYPDGDSSMVQSPSKLLSVAGNNKVTLILRSNNGCNDAISKEVDVKQQSKANFTANDVCEDSSVDFINTSQDGISYDWKFGDGKTSNLQSPKHLYQIAGQSTTFNVAMVARVSNGCSDSITKAVTVNANPKSDFTFTVSGNQVIFTATETNASNYHWDFGDGGNTNTANQKTTYSYTKFQSGKYNGCLKVSNIAGCVAESCQEVNISGAANPLIKPNGFKIYPNPNKGSFTIKLNEPKGKLSIEMYDAIGQMVHKGETFQSSTIINLKLSEGIYLVRVMNGGEVYMGRVMIGK